MSRKNNEKIIDVIIIGAGASGLMASIAAARSGCSVMILDHHSTPAKKILSTGNGKCNFTNELQNISCYRSDDPEFVMEMIKKFSWTDTLAFFLELGVYSKSRNGYYYPRNGQASCIRETLLLEAERLHIRIINDVSIQKIKKENSIFWIQTRSGNHKAKKCILATGGKAAPKTGSDGSGYIYAMQLGHTIITPLPALVPLVSKERWLKDTAGVRCDAAVCLYADGVLLAEDTGELQLTDYGISGIPVFQISRFASVALSNRQKVSVKIDFLPEVSADDLKKALLVLSQRQGQLKNWYHILSGICNNKIAAMICDKIKLSEEPVLSLSEKSFKKQLEQIVRQVKDTTVVITGTKRLEQAQVTCGGVPLKEIGPDMQSKIVSGLYFAGEILNVDGICGGYNLQWAWSSGYIAGMNASH